VIELPWPHKLLWPNGSRGSIRARSGESRKHKDWAYLAAKAEKLTASDGRIPVLLKFYPKPKGPPPDRDNCMASGKFYLDGIAKAMGVDDRLFDPRVEVADERLSVVRFYFGEEAL
jgi:crossover junction endodeoxyribonuclease RusA